MTYSVTCVTSVSAPRSLRDDLAGAGLLVGAHQAKRRSSVAQTASRLKSQHPRSERSGVLVLSEARDAHPHACNTCDALEHRLPRLSAALGSALFRSSAPPGGFLAQICDPSIYRELRAYCGYASLAVANWNCGEARWPVASRGFPSDVLVRASSRVWLDTAHSATAMHLASGRDSRQLG